MSSRTAGLPLVEIIRDPETARIALKRPRPKLLAVLREPGTSTTLASRFGLKRQRIAYHLRQLEDVGLLRRVGERKRRGAVEHVVQATAQRYLLSPNLLGDIGTVLPEDVFAAGHFGRTPLALAAGRTLQDLAVLGDGLGEDVPALAMPSLIKLRSAEAFSSLVDELAREIGRVVAKYHDPDAQTLAHWIVFGAYASCPVGEGVAEWP